MSLDINCIAIDESAERQSADARNGYADRSSSFNQRPRYNHWANLHPGDVVDYPEFKSLSYREEIKLIRRAQAGDIEARNIVWQTNVRLAYSVVNRFQIPRDILADAIQAGIIGLKRAIEKFEVERYAAFSTYAWYWVNQSVQRFLTQQKFRLRMPSYLYGDFHRYRRGLSKCRTENESFLFREHWALKNAGLQERLESIRLLHSASRLGRRAYRQSERFDLGSDIAFAEFKAILEKALTRLQDRDRKVIELRYGMEGNEEHTLEEVGEKLGVTRKRIRQIQARAERRLLEMLSVEIEELSTLLGVQFSLPQLEICDGGKGGI